MIKNKVKKCHYTTKKGCDPSYLIGNRFARLTVLAFVGWKYTKYRGNCAQWLCKCDCGNEVIKLGDSLRKGHTGSCGCLQRENGILHGKKTVKNSAENALYGIYKIAARRRGLPFVINMSEFLLITGKNCTYCGIEPKQIRYNQSSTEDTKEFYVYNGIDRLDNSRGYEPDNCVPCCRVCNTMKMSMSFDDFKSHISRIYYHLNNN